MSEKFAVVDIEATGGTQKVDRIIEIGIVQIDNGAITNSFSSLVNPGIGIPPFISRLTNIRNDMVKSAPAFHEIAKKIVEMTRGRSLVAHNVNFDYRILREEFNRLGYEFKSDTLCTARLSRDYFPNLEKFNLASVAASLNVALPDQHRAGDDAMATAKVMIHILKKTEASGEALKSMNIYKQKSRLPEHMQEEQLLDIPNVCGVYYMLDKDKQPIYIGKSLKIRTRVRSHFTEMSSKTEKMQKLVYHIDYVDSGSEIMAEIFESLEIRKHKPFLNKAKRKTKFDTVLVESQENGYGTFDFKHKSKLKKKDNVLQWFSSKNAAKAYMATLVQKYELCGCLCKVNTQSNGCINFKIGQCKGAFLEYENTESYNERFEEAKTNANRLFSQDLVLCARGRSSSEFSVFYIKDARVQYIGYLPTDFNYKSDAALISNLQKIQFLPEIDRIAYRHLYHDNFIKKITPQIGQLTS